MLGLPAAAGNRPLIPPFGSSGNARQLWHLQPTGNWTMCLHRPTHPSYHYVPSDGLGHLSTLLIFITGEHHQLGAALVPLCLHPYFRGMLCSYSKRCPRPNPKGSCKVKGIIPALSIVHAHPALEPLLGLSPCHPQGLLFSMEMPRPSCVTCLCHVSARSDVCWLAPRFTCCHTDPAFVGP